MPNKRNYSARGERSEPEKRSSDLQNIKTRSGSPSYDFNLPNATIKDIDQAINNYFDKTLDIRIPINDEPTKVSVIFAAGERWALVRKRKPIRDKDGKLILPLITIRRTDINRDPGFGGLPGDYGELTIKRKISKHNPNYQNITNRQQLKNQKNVAVSGSKTDNHEGTRRLSAQGAVYRGKLHPSVLRSTNIYEIYSVDFPDFFTVEYEVIIWTQYMSQANKINEIIFKSFDWKNSIKFDTDKGYWYTAFVQPEISNQSNEEDYSNEERIIRTSMTIKVNGYILGDSDQERISVRKTLSAPQLIFDVSTGTGAAELYDPAKKNVDPTGEISELKDNQRKGITRTRKNNGDPLLPMKKRTRKTSEKVWFFDDVEDLESFFIE